MPSQATVVGRERELAVIETFLAAAPCPRALVVEGDAGAGKTTLLRAALARAADAQVLACWPAQGESALAFAGLGDMLRAHVDDVLPALPGPQRRALAGALYLAEATDDVSGAHVVGAATLSALGHLAAQRPALLVVDDGQWLDVASAEVLAWVVRRLPDGLPVRLLLARRTSADPLPLDLERVFDDGLLTRLAPAPLDEDAVYALVRERLGVVLGPSDLRRVHELSGGNPFFALELARAAGRDGLPGSLAGLVEGRLARLPAPTLAALGVCANVARPSLELLAAATEADPWVLVGPALDDGVVYLAEGVVRFTHPLLAEGAGAAIAPSALRALHVRLADIAPTSDERATHRALVTEPPDERTADALEEAAGDALRRGATPMAAELSAQAVRFTPPHDDALVRRALAAGTALYAAGHTDRAVAVLDEASGRASAGAGRARLRSELAYVLPAEQARRRAVEAIAEAEGDPTVLTQCWTTLAFAQTRAGDYAAGLESNREALRHAPQAEPRIAAAAYIRAGRDVFVESTSAGQELFDRARRCEEASDLLLDADDSPDLAEGMMLSWADRLDEARPLMERRLRQGDEYGDEIARLSASFQLAALEWRAGNWDAAARHAARVDRLHEQTAGELDDGWCLWIGAMIAAARGETASARARMEAGLVLMDAVGEVFFRRFNLWAFGLLELAAGRPDEALRYVEGLSHDLDANGFREHGLTHHVADELEALILVGREADAERRIAEEAARAEDLDRDRMRGVVGRAQGMLASRRGEHDAAVEVLLRAEALHGAGPLPFDHGRTLLALGEAQRRAGRRRDARASLQSAAAIFERLGARPWSARTEAELGRLGGRVASADELTVTEQRVAALVAGGRTNREVAAELVVSVRAVEANLTRVYAKLGVRSRAELAARFRD